MPLPASGFQETDIGHNVQWSALETVAKDINAFITEGAPADDLVRSEAAPAISTLVVEPGRVIVERIGG